jgi:hypothetical protein
VIWARRIPAKPPQKLMMIDMTNMGTDLDRMGHGEKIHLEHGRQMCSIILLEARELMAGE